MKQLTQPMTAAAYANATFAATAFVASVVAPCMGGNGVGRGPHRPLDGSPPPL